LNSCADEKGEIAKMDFGALVPIAAMGVGLITDGGLQTAAPIEALRETPEPTPQA
jgi:hypothetical protein